MMIEGNSANIEQQSADVVWRTYGKRLAAFIRRRIDDDTVADDILQDVFLRVQQNLSALRRPERLQAWLYQIARNAVIDHYRSRDFMEVLPESIQQEEPDSREVALREMAECLEPMIDRLPPPYRDALRLSEIEGLKQRTIAQILGLSLSGAKSRVQRGRTMLRELFIECCHIYRDAAGRIASCEVRDI